MKYHIESRVLKIVARTKLPTKWGEFQVIGFQHEILNGRKRCESAVALIMGDVSKYIPLVRVHSECLTGEALGSLRCDCGEQLELALRAISQEGCGILIYEHQEGRGIGLMAKLQAYSLQDRGLDTIEANHALGFRADCRDFATPVAILNELGASRVRLLSNNPQKSRCLVKGGIDVVEVVPCEAAPNTYSLGYLRAKKEKMGHTLTLVSEQEEFRAAGFSGESSPRASVEEALHELKAGRMIVVTDDEDRENEGDLLMAADMATPESINFMARHGCGLICLAMTNERADELNLGPMSRENTALGGTGFTVSIDALGHGMTTGISAQDRARTIRTAVDPRYGAEDFARPGHVFPLRSRDGGVLERRGHTEAAVDLARLAGLSPAGVICEILNEDGTMARVPELQRFCKSHQLKMLTIADLVEYRLGLAGSISPKQIYAPGLEAQFSMGTEMSTSQKPPCAIQV